MQRAADIDEQVPVLIVGGGAGLTASMLLARPGVDRLLVSARPHTSDLPKAHVLNQRALEVLDDVGVADAVAQRGTPPGTWRRRPTTRAWPGPGANTGAAWRAWKPGALVGTMKAGVRRARGGS